MLYVAAKLSYLKCQILKNSESSWNKIIINILLELVVSSSFNFIHDSTVHEMESVNSK